LGVRLHGRWRLAGVVGVVGFAFAQIPAAVERCAHEVRRIKPELQLIEMMDACADCVWWVDPRPRLGTRARHDGCEIIAGASDHVVGEDLYCAGWQDAAAARAAFATCTHTARWDGDAYRTIQHGRDSSRYGPPPSLAPAASTVDPNPE
jgi:hypothetical protein